MLDRPILDTVDADLREGIRAARETLELSAQAEALLTSGVLKAFFYNEALAAYQKYLKNETGAAEDGRAVNRLYRHLVLAFARGETAAEHLADHVNQGGKL